MKSRVLVLLYAVSIFVSAFLLFQIQPLISKAILPWFGGTPNVWTTCLLFFQSVLFGGYVYSHLLNSKLNPRAQAIVHTLLLLIAVFTLTILPEETWKPTGEESPVLKILGLLLATVGLPYFVLSTTGPLLQAWFSRTFPGVSPYRLYSLSNIGSLLALLSYPFLFEPLIGMSHQASLWMSGFYVLAALCITCGWVAAFTSSSNSNNSSDRGELSSETNPERTSISTGGKWWQWFGLSMTASALLLATTNQVCQDVAVVPFLWVVPLSLYLLTFILCFDSDRWYSRMWYGLGAAIGVGSVTFVLNQPTGFNISIQLVFYFSTLFMGCMVCHGELARLKPEPKRLTSFYLVMSAGGATGGLFVGVLAPLIFPIYLELHLFLAAIAVISINVYLNQNQQRPEDDQIPAIAVIGLYGVLVGLSMMLTNHAYKRITRAKYVERNFYGVIRLVEQLKHDPDESSLNMSHGRILHGIQYQSPKRKMWPTTYYGHDSGIGRLLLTMQDRRTSIKVGIVGLGTGTLCTYGRSSDHFRFYEINAAVKRITGANFTFLKDSPCESEVLLGDARLLLEAEEPQQYDVIVLDAFSGDAIPTHLLTQEVMQYYVKHLKGDGVIAFHISNLHFDLAPVVAALADQHEMKMRQTSSNGDDETGQVGNAWFLVSRSDELFNDERLVEVDREITGERVEWTDDFSNLYSVLK